MSDRSAAIRLRIVEMIEGNALSVPSMSDGLAEACSLMGRVAQGADYALQRFAIPANRSGFRRLAKSRRIYIRRAKAAARRRRARHEG